MQIDWLDKLRYYLQTLAFCLAVSAIQFAFQSSRPYEWPLVYSLCIGTSTWALIDFGRHAFASSAETGWPQGAAGILLPLAGIVGGYFVGTLAGDAWFGWSSWDAHPYARSQLPVSIIVTALAGVAGTWFFYSKNKATYLETKVSEARRHATESRLKLLEAQIEPHMLFNTLANLRALIGTDPARALTMLDHLNNYLRATLRASRAATHPLQTEFDRLRDYLEIMSVRLGPRLAYTLDLPPALAACEVPPLLLQPLVENAIKHGLEPSVAGGAITVSASLAEGCLRLAVVDTGVGLTGDGSPNGFGLAQVRERLQTLHDSQGYLELVPNPGGGASAQITLPLAGLA
jgi:hypothetical protein